VGVSFAYTESVSVGNLKSGYSLRFRNTAFRVIIPPIPNEKAWTFTLAAYESGRIVGKTGKVSSLPRAGTPSTTAAGSP
jgi:hypothetical protein